MSALTLLGTAPIIDDWDELPKPSQRFRDYAAEHREVPPGPAADIDLFRVMNGDVLEFDEPAGRPMLELAWSRAIDPAAAANHHRARIIGRAEGNAGWGDRNLGVGAGGRLRAGQPARGRRAGPRSVCG